MTSTPWGGLLTLVAITITALALIVLHVVPTGLNPLRDPVSQYGITRYRGWYATAAISAGAAGIGAIVFFAGLPGSIATVILLAVFAAARIVIPFVPMDAPETGATRRGRMHNVLAFLAFGAVTAAGFVGAGTLHDAGHAGASALSTVFAAVMAVGAIGLLVTRLSHRMRGLFGAAERLIYIGFVAWFVLVGVTALGGG